MIAGLEPLDLVGAFLAFLFTILVLLYAFGDNVLFRLVLHIFIGVSAGYAAGVVVYAVLIPHLFLPLLGLLSGASLSNLLDALGRLVLVALLLAKLSPRTAALGNPATALMVGVGAAAAVGGAVQGTLFPQIASTTNFFDPAAILRAFQTGDVVLVLNLLVDGVFILIGTVSTLVYFHFGARSLPNQIAQRAGLLRAIAWIGQAFVAITFGVLFGGILTAALTALVDRLFFLWDFVGRFLALAGL